MLRPPYAPHRSGGRSRVIDPPDPREALRRLKRQELPPWVEGELGAGVPVGQRSDELLRVARAFARAGLTEEDFVNRVRPSPLNKFAGRPDEEARLRGIYADADAYVRSHWADDLDPWLRSFRQRALDPRAWEGSGGWAAQRVYLALLMASPNLRERKVVVSVRRLAELAGVGTGVVRKALLELERKGLVTKGAWGRYGTEYFLHVPPGRGRTEDTVLGRERERESVIPRTVSSIRLGAIHPAFRGNPAAWNVMWWLDHDRGRRFGELVRLSGRNRATVNRYLKRFERHGIVVKSADGYRLATADPEELEFLLERMALETHKLEEAERQRARHRREQVRYRVQKGIEDPICLEHGMRPMVVEGGIPRLCPGFGSVDNRACRFEGFEPLQAVQAVRADAEVLIEHSNKSVLSRVLAERERASQDGGRTSQGQEESRVAVPGSTG
jgi:DNA-binding transcriptional regulator YhcF (GntR family)